MSSPATPEKKLTTKEQLFCNEYLSNGFNATEAYIRAGYKSVEFARQEGYRLTTKPYIRKYLDESIDALIGDRKGLTKELIDELKKYAFMSDQEMERLQVRASDKKGYIELLGKYLTMFNDKSEIVHKTVDDEGKEKGIDLKSITEAEAKAMYLKMQNED